MTEMEHSVRPGLLGRLRLPPALRYPLYRRYWLGTLASVSGWQMMYLAESWLAYELTGSPLYLGYVGVAAAVPAIVLNLVGGVVADRVDKRMLILLGQAVMMVVIGLLGVLTVTGDIQPWHLITAAFITGAFGAFEHPARESLYPHLIDRKVMPSAVALDSAVWQGTRIAAPATAGLIIATVGTAAVFFVATAGFLAMCFVAVSLPALPIVRGQSSSAIRDMVIGLKFINREPIFKFLISMTFFNSFFGMSFLTLMPIFAEDVLDVGAGGLGVLLSVSGIGSLSTTLVISSLGLPRRVGMFMVGGAVMYGLAICAFALSSEYLGSYPLAIAIVIVLGSFNSMYMVSIMSTLQLMTPDHMRGRVMGFYGMTWSIFPLGGMQAGGLANFIGAPLAVTVGGVAVAAFALGPALFNARIRRLDTGATALATEAAQAEGRETERVGQGGTPGL